MLEKNKPILIVLSPYKFIKFEYEVNELEYLKDECDIYVLDLSLFLNSAFSKEIAADLAIDESIIVTKSLREIYQFLKKTSKFSSERKIFIINNIPGETAKEILCIFLLKVYFSSKRIKYISFKNPGIPIFINKKVMEDRFFMFLKSLRNFARLRLIMSRYFFSKISGFLKLKSTYILVAGNDWSNQLINETTSLSNNISTIILGHSQDYSRNMIVGESLEEYSLANKIIFLDAPGPFSRGDYFYNKTHEHISVEKWYPSLNNFFDFLEKSYETEVIICGHNKTKYPLVSPLFGGRKVIYGETISLIRASKFVVTRASTAISIAILNKKPLIFIYSDELINDYVMYENIKNLSRITGGRFVNIDYPNNYPDSIHPIDQNAYNLYVEKCLTSSPNKGPLHRIIIEEILSRPQ